MLSRLMTLGKGQGSFHQSITLRSSKYWFGKPFLSLKVQLTQQPFQRSLFTCNFPFPPFPLYLRAACNSKEQALLLLRVLTWYLPARQKNIYPKIRGECSTLYSLGPVHVASDTGIPSEHTLIFFAWCLFSFKTVLLGIQGSCGMCNLPASVSCPGLWSAGNQTWVFVHVTQLVHFILRQDFTKLPRLTLNSALLSQALHLLAS